MGWDFFAGWWAGIMCAFIWWLVWGKPGSDTKREPLTESEQKEWLRMYNHNINQGYTANLSRSEADNHIRALRSIQGG